MKKVFELIFNSFFFLVLPACAFWGGYRSTDLLFRAQKIPYPFEVFGIAAGLGFAAVFLTARFGRLTRLH